HLISECRSWYQRVASILSTIPHEVVVTRVTDLDAPMVALVDQGAGLYIEHFRSATTRTVAGMKAVADTAATPEVEAGVAATAEVGGAVTAGHLAEAIAVLDTTVAQPLQEEVTGQGHHLQGLRAVGLGGPPSTTALAYLVRRDPIQSLHEGSKSPDRGLPLKKKPRHAHSPSDDRRSPVRRRVGSEDRDRSPPVEISSQETITSNYADHRGDRSGHRSQDYRQASPQPSSSKKTVRDKGKQLIARNRLHDIFSLITRDKSFTLDEDISIAIQRNPYAEPSEESTVRKVFDEELFTMIRSHSEGQRQIFDREELKAFGHDSNLADDPDFERRVIRLKPGKSSQEFESSSSSVQRFRSTHKITRMIERDSGRSRSKSPPRRREQEVRLKLVPDPRYEARYADMQKKDGSSSRKLDPADLRHELRGSATTSAATSSSKSLGDLRSRLDKRDERPWLSMKDDSRDVKADSRRDTDAPDYSRRKDKHQYDKEPSFADKYQYAEWMDKPEMIPKNPSYFEHDNRDELRDSRDRGRGRGRARGFRGRFMYRRPYRPFRGRGTFRGRGRGSSDRYSPPPHSSHSRSRYDDVKRLEGEWKHDKFAELEGDTKPHREDDQHPHSTSER
ncbi:hypothetical protein BaRGS_00022782, partial [Batillaria attramentaria]